jgi:hypothetical protein
LGGVVEQTSKVVLVLSWLEGHDLPLGLLRHGRTYLACACLPVPKLETFRYIYRYIRRNYNI